MIHRILGQNAWNLHDSLGICWKQKIEVENFARNLEDEETNVYGLSRAIFYSKDLGYLLWGFPPFPGGTDWGSGIIFDILTMFCTGLFFFCLLI